MNHDQTVVAVFPDHKLAEDAIKMLAKEGFDLKALSVVGKGFHTEEKVVGFYNIGDRMSFWGVQGAFWGALWGLFFGGVILTMPALGPVIMLGYLAPAVVGAIEGAMVIGGLSALGAALFSLGIPQDSVIQYEAALKADGFLVLAHGTHAEMDRAKAILGHASPLSVDAHGVLVPAAPALSAGYAGRQPAEATAF